MPPGTNRRRESRSAAYGAVQILIDSPLPSRITATLLDVSVNGFRARHHCADLQRGDRVRFDHGSGAGSAVVIWTRVSGVVIESGFLLADPRATNPGGTQPAALPRNAGTSGTDDSGKRTRS
jgi:hypothetical protein